MTLHAFAIREKYTYFIYNRYNIIEIDKIEERTLLNSTNDSLDPFDYHFEKCGLGSFKTLEHTQKHTCWPRDDDDENTEGENDVLFEEGEDEILVETQYLNGKIEAVKIFEEKFVICCERDSVYVLDNVVINVFVSIVIKAKVILIY